MDSSGRGPAVQGTRLGRSDDRSCHHDPEPAVSGMAVDELGGVGRGGSQVGRGVHALLAEHLGSHSGHLLHLAGAR